MSHVKIGIIGCLGRMGQALTAATLNHVDTELVGATEMLGNAKVGQKLKHPQTGEETDVVISTDADQLIKNSDVVLDFTCPTATVSHAKIAAIYGTSLVVGTTGLSSDDELALMSASAKTSIIYASNYSQGVNLLFHLTKIAAEMLDDNFDIEIVEMHHREKIDAPSGTAIAIGHAAAFGRGRDLKEIMDAGRDGVTGARKVGNIGFASLRGGNVAGDHTISFNADDERIELTHKAGDRSIFAKGAVKAALWVHTVNDGLYDMSDVLGLKT